nr:NADH dehydrogenase subunit 3 [Cerceris albofasciata]
MIFILIMSLIFMLPLMIILINFIFYKKIKMDREKNTPFECGFDPITSPRLPFSIQFFLVSLMFLIFDIEIALLIPSIQSFSNISKNFVLCMTIFLLSLIISIYIEWSENNINWII